jgi:hypothetical protein
MSALQDCFVPLADSRSPALDAELQRDDGARPSPLSGWMPCPSTLDLPTAVVQDERDAEIHRPRAALERKQFEIDVLAEALDYARTFLDDEPTR